MSPPQESEYDDINDMQLMRLPAPEMRAKISRILHGAVEVLPREWLRK
jgi:hypothetical protein